MRKLMPAITACFVLSYALLASAAPGVIKLEVRTSADQAAVLAEDLKQVQGVWVRETGTDGNAPFRRSIKHIQGNRETVTYYSKDGFIVKAHEVDFKLERRDGVRIFTYWNLHVTAGPDEGKVFPDHTSYIYRVDDKHFAEVWGFLPGQEKQATTLAVHVRGKVQDIPKDAKVVQQGKDPATAAPVKEKPDD